MTEIKDLYSYRKQIIDNRDMLAGSVDCVLTVVTVVAATGEYKAVLVQWLENDTANDESDPEKKDDPRTEMVDFPIDFGTGSSRLDALEDLLAKTEDRLRETLRKRGKRGFVHNKWFQILGIPDERAPGLGSQDSQVVGMTEMLDDMDMANN